MKPPKPDSEQEMIHQLWYAVIGANSEGISERIRNIDDRLLKVESKLPQYLTYEQHEKLKHSAKKDSWRKQDVIFTILLIFLSIINTVIAMR